MKELLESEEFKLEDYELDGFSILSIISDQLIKGFRPKGSEQVELIDFYLNNKIVETINNNLGRFYKFTEVGHKFYLKAKARKEFTKLGLVS